MDTSYQDSHSRSPTRNKRKRKRHHSRSRSPHQTSTARILPLNARQLSKHDLKQYRPMFALYLDIQKRLNIDDLEDSEVKGRWKSFTKKWNNGELAEGWYAPQTLQKAINSNSDVINSNSPETPAQHQQDSDDDYGPSLPPSTSQDTHTPLSSNATRFGPSIPSTSDIQANREQSAEDATLAREQEREFLRQQRKSDRKLQTNRLDDLTPRAEAGTRERALENKRLAAASNRSFASAKHDSGDVELRDADVMGADGGEELRKMKRDMDRKKNEREIRREEVMRARRAEREEKLKGLRDKEERTMGMLKEIAKERFGGGGAG